MRILTVLFAIILFSFQAYSGQYKGAYITYKPLGKAIDNKYEISLITFVNSNVGAPSFRDHETIHFGDGQEESVASTSDKLPIGQNTWKNVYTTVHVYPGDGCYAMSWVSLEADYKNTKSQYAFRAQSQLCINANLGVPRINHSPKVNGNLHFIGNTHSAYTADLQIADTMNTGDSLFTEIMAQGDNDYFSPTNVSPYHNKIYLKNGEVIWDKANEPGHYLLWLRNYEYRSTLVQSGVKFIRQIGYMDVLWVVEVEGPVSVDNASKQKELQVTYFNQTVIISSSVDQASFSLYSLSGTRILQEQMQNGHAEFSSAFIKPGCYIIQMDGAKKSISQKIIIQ